MVAWDVGADRPVALVTGASSGFGLLASVELARAGHRVFASMRDLARADRLLAAAREAGVSVETVRLDVTDGAQIAAAVAEVEARAGRIDVLVNNAGYGIGGFFEDLEMAELREQFETNFFGLAAVTKAVLPGMRARRRGRIINVSSIAGRIGNPAMSAYSSSKWAVEGLSESLRYELAPFGIQVVLVEPGTFRTDIFDRNKRVARRASDPSSPYYTVAKKIEAGVARLVERSTQDPRDVAHVIVKAATVKRPALRYPVGRDARAQVAALALVPARLLELAVHAYLRRLTGGAT